jgi:transposase
MYSLDFRLQTLSLYRRLKSYRKVCSLMNISISTLSFWMNKGIISAKRKFKPLKLTTLIQQFVEQYLEREPFTTITSIGLELYKSLKQKVSKKSIYKIVKHLKFSKKKAYHFCNKKNPIKAVAFKDKLKEKRGTKLYSLDECYFSEKVLCNYGYSKRGKRLSTSLMCNNYKKKSLLLAICNDGSYIYKIYDKSVNKEKFQDFLTLLEPEDNCSIILDNVSFHRSLKKDNFIFTPPYEPDYNPVELCFSKIKQTFRKLNSRHDRKDVESLIHQSISLVSNLNIQNYFKHVLNMI